MRLPLVLLAALVLTACQPPAATQTVQATASTAPSASPSPSPSPSAVPATLAVVTGVVKAPAGLVGAVISNNGASVIPTGGGNVIPTGGGNVIPTGGGNLRLFAVTEAPLANTEVFLADAAGQPYPGLPSTTTDASGQFTFPQVPAGYTYMVVARAKDTARNKDVTLQTLVAPSALGATTAIDTSTSLVTLAVTQDQGQALGQFNAAAFRTATEATAKNLGDQDVPDLSDRGAILAKVEDLSKAVAELKSALDAIRQDLKDIKQSLDELKTQLATQQQQAQQPPPQQQQPMGGQPPVNPQGSQQGMGPGGCLPPVTFEVVLQMAVDPPRYPLTLELRPTKDTPQPFFKAVFQTPGSTATLTAPPNCGHFLVLRGGGGNVIASTDQPWTPPPGAGDAQHPKVNLPF